MDHKLRDLLNQAWSSACCDAPTRPSCQVVDGNFVFVVKGKVKAELVKTAGVPSHAIVVENSDQTTFTWPSIADEIFGDTGILAGKLPNYEVRAPQLHMARMSQRVIEMGNKAIIEAGTGVGKSIAYAPVAMMLGERIIISTSNKTLQSQLYKKDMPFLADALPGNYTVALAIGKRNYACRKKCENDLDGITIEDPQLANWYASTADGNLENLTFQLTPTQTDSVAVDEHCTGKKCDYYDNCFYYDAKAQLEEADVIVTNHALTALDFALPHIDILPTPDMWIIDEAHKLSDYVRNAYTVTFTFGTITRAQVLIESYGIPYNDGLRSRLASQVQGIIGNSADRQIGLADQLDAGIQLASHLRDCALAIWNPRDYPEGAEEIKRCRDANRITRVADRVLQCSEIAHPKYVRWIENGDRIEVVLSPHDVSDKIGEMGGNMAAPVVDRTRCVICGHKFDGEWVYASAGAACCPDECLSYFDPMQYDSIETTLAEWLASPAPTHQEGRAPILFASATLAVAENKQPSLELFKHESGIPLALDMIAKSPFDYEGKALLYVPNGNTPAPNKKAQAHRDYLVDEIRTLVNAARGGALLLFTSYQNMKYCHDALAFDFGIDYLTLKQGDLPKAELIKQFENDGNAVLFATKSFYEGVSVEGSALRLVTMDKLPFGPLTPLAKARDETLKDFARSELGYAGSQLDFYPFNKRAVPEMINELKQGFGRLIRTQRDPGGVVAILDPRLRTTRYGRDNVLPSLPSAKLTDSLALVTERYVGEMGEPATSLEIFELFAADVPF